MNYRHKLLNQQIKRDYIPLTTHQEEVQQLKKEHQEQLKQINLLFDPAAVHKGKINFNELHTLIVRYKEIVEQERKTWRKKNNHD